MHLLAERDARADYVGEVVGYPGATIRMAWLRPPDGGPILELLQYIDPAGTPVDTARPNPGAAHVAPSVYWIVQSGSLSLPGAPTQVGGNCTFDAPSQADTSSTRQRRCWTLSWTAAAIAPGS